MRDEHPGETKCVRETNLITPAMGQTSPHPSTPPPSCTATRIYPPSFLPLSHQSALPSCRSIVCRWKHAAAMERLAPLSIILTAVEIHSPCCIKECPQSLTPHLNTKGIWGTFFTAIFHVLAPDFLLKKILLHFGALLPHRICFSNF